MPARRPERARAHQRLAVAQEREHVALRPLLGDAERRGERGAHRPAHVEVRAVVAGRAQRGRRRCRARRPPARPAPRRAPPRRCWSGSRSSSSASSRIGASTRAPSATATAPLTTRAASAGSRSGNGLHAERLEHRHRGPAERHLGGVALAERAAHAEHEPGSRGRRGSTSEPIALSELPRPEHWASTSGIPPAARYPAA